MDIAGLLCAYVETERVLDIPLCNLQLGALCNGIDRGSYTTLSARLSYGVVRPMNKAELDDWAVEF